MIEGEVIDDTNPYSLELRLFRKSPLATRIGDNIKNPSTTRDLLIQKKTQIKRILQEKEELRSIANKSYTQNLAMSPKRTIRMPNIRIFLSRVKKVQSDSLDLESSDPEPYINDQPSITFPADCEIFWSKIETTGWKPETRQQATLTVVQGKFYLIGGVSRNINSDINVFLPSYRRWDRISHMGVESEPRFGHSAVEYQQRIFVFGGGTDYNEVHKLRECLTGVKVFSVADSEIFNLKCQGSYIATRKQHCYAAVGKHMFIQGGLNQKNNLLDDAALLNLEKGNWKLVSIKGSGPGLCALHVAATVLSPEQKDAMSIYTMPLNRKNVGVNSGIYVFGGIGADRKANNRLFVLKFGSKQLSWISPVTQGQPPSPRFQHSMNYNDKLEILIVFGGRIDISNTSHYTCFNDVHILRIQDLMWTSVKVLGNVPSSRSGHCAGTYGSKLYIFGGVSTSSYCGSSLYALELNPKTAKHFIEDEEKRKARELEMEVIRARKVEFAN